MPDESSPSQAGNIAMGARARSGTGGSADTGGSGLTPNEVKARMKTIIDHPSGLERVEQRLQWRASCEAGA